MVGWAFALSSETKEEGPNVDHPSVPLLSVSSVYSVPIPGYYAISYSLLKR